MKKVFRIQGQITGMPIVLFNFEGPYKKGNSKEIAGLNKEGKTGV